MPVYDLPPRDPKTERIHVVVDTPRGSRAKYKYVADSALFALSKMLPLGHYFPYNFGFIPGTRGEDGDQLDVLILLDEPLALGTVIPVRLIGVLKALQTQDGGTLRNDRLIGVVETRQNPAEITDLSQLHPQRLDEIEHFFMSYNQLEGRRFEPDGREGADAANALVDSCC
jgi:inorganic pyrophosphatase